MGLKEILGIAGIGLMSFLPMKNYSQNSQINFEKTSFEESKTKTEITDKLIFIDSYADWCWACKIMDKDVFTNDNVAKFYNENFINVKMDMDSEEGKKLNSIYSVRLLPTFLYLDGKGNLMHQGAGLSSPEEFVQLGKDALNPETQLASLKQRYNEGERGRDFVPTYLKALQKAWMPYKDVLKDYFKTQKDEDLVLRKNWDLIFLNIYDVDIESREFEYLIGNKKKFDEIYTSDSVDNNIFDAYLYNFKNILYKKSFDSANYNEWKEKVKKQKFSKLDGVLLEAEMEYNAKTEDWNKYVSNAVLLIDEHKRNYNSERLNSIAWNFFENVKDPTYLKKAVNWARHSVELERRASNNDTYASLLYVTGDTARAIEIETNAIKMAKEKGDQGLAGNLSKTLEKMKKGETLHEPKL